MFLQSDVEVVFTVKNLSAAERFDPMWITDAQGLCPRNVIDIKRGVGLF
jgi:hypothetical protein